MLEVDFLKSQKQVRSQQGVTSSGTVHVIGGRCRKAPVHAKLAEVFGGESFHNVHIVQNVRRRAQTHDAASTAVVGHS